MKDYVNFFFRNHDDLSLEIILIIIEEKSTTSLFHPNN